MSAARANASAPKREVPRAAPVREVSAGRIADTITYVRETLGNVVAAAEVDKLTSILERTGENVANVRDLVAEQVSSRVTPIASSVNGKCQNFLDTHPTIKYRINQGKDTIVHSGEYVGSSVVRGKETVGAIAGSGVQKVNHARDAVYERTEIAYKRTLDGVDEIFKQLDAIQTTVKQNKHTKMIEQSVSKVKDRVSDVAYQVKGNVHEVIRVLDDNRNRAVNATVDTIHRGADFTYGVGEGVVDKSIDVVVYVDSKLKVEDRIIYAFQKLDSLVLTPLSVRERLSPFTPVVHKCVGTAKSIESRLVNGKISQVCYGTIDQFHLKKGAIAA